MPLISVKFDKSQISRALDEEVRALSRRVRAATELAGRELLLDPLRQMTRQALKSKKLPTTWRAALYPKGETTTLSPAFFAYSKAAKIMIAFDEGATIRPVGGKKYLWIPTENVPRTTGGRRLTPPELSARMGGKLYVTKSSKGTLFAYGWAKQVSRRSHRRGGRRYDDVRNLNRRERQAGETRQRIVFYILKPQVRLSKRLDIKSIADKAGTSYRAIYERAANNS